MIRSTVRLPCISGLFYIELNLAARADGVYKSGFAKTPEAYQDAVVQLFEALDRVEALLKGQTFLTGDQLTEADVRLFVTIVSSGSPCASEGVLSTNFFLFRYDSIPYMSAISSATFELFVMATLRSIGKSLMRIIPRLLPAHWYYL
jgi:glutathione S-transferase